MTLDDEQTRAAYYVAAEVIRSRQRTGQPIPAWLRKHYDRPDTAVRGMAPRGHSVAENGDGGTQSQHEQHDVIGSREVGAMLSIAPRQVRRRAGQLGGVLVAGRLLFLRETVAEYARRGGR